MHEGIAREVNAKDCLETGDYFLCAFICQRAVEKALRAYVMKTTRKTPGRTASPLQLAQTAQVPSSFYPFLRGLSLEHFVSHDVTEDLPRTQFSQAEAREILEKTEAIMAWLDSRMNRR